jgi:hypothetical protein
MDGSWAGRVVRTVGVLTVAVAIVIPVTLLVRRVDLNPFILVTEAMTIVAAVVALRTRRALPTALLLIVATYSTIFGWYVLFYLPLLVLLAIAGVARAVEAVATRRRTALSPRS